MLLFDNNDDDDEAAKRLWIYRNIDEITGDADHTGLVARLLGELNANILQFRDYWGRLVDYQPRPRRPLPEGKNTNGRPVWEPPALAYDDMIDQEDYDKRRKALLKYHKGDVVKTTKYFDLDHESVLLKRAQNWAYDERQAAENDEEIQNFFKGFQAELGIDRQEVTKEFEVLDVFLTKTEEGEYLAQRRTADWKWPPGVANFTVAEESSPAVLPVASSPPLITKAPSTEISEEPPQCTPPHLPTLKPTSPQTTERTPLLHQPSPSYAAADQHSPNSNAEASPGLSTLLCGCACQCLGRKLEWNLTSS